MRYPEQPTENALRITLDVDGKAWTVVDPVAILGYYAQRMRERPGGWRYVLGCGKCEQLCTDATLCRCCTQTTNRPYDLAGGHVRVLAALELVERLAAYKSRHEPRYARA